MNVVKNEAHVIANRTYIVMRKLSFVDAMRIIVMQIEDFTVASATTYVKIHMM